MNEQVSQVILTQLQEKLKREFIVADLKKQPEAEVTDNKHGVVFTCDPRKTLAMRLMEQQFGKTMEELLDMRRRGSDVARMLGVKESTVSKWRKKLGMRA